MNTKDVKRSNGAVPWPWWLRWRRMTMMATDDEDNEEEEGWTNYGSYILKISLTQANVQRAQNITGIAYKMNFCFMLCFCWAHLSEWQSRHWIRLFHRCHWVNHARESLVWTVKVIECSMAFRPVIGLDWHRPSLLSKWQLLSAN